MVAQLSEAMTYVYNLSMLCLQSCSPSYLLMASLDGARAYAQQHDWQQPIQASQLIVRELQQLPGLQLLSLPSQRPPGSPH